MIKVIGGVTMYIYTRFIRIVIGVTAVGANTGCEILADTAVTI